jgi:hypothetical protein
MKNGEKDTEEVFAVRRCCPVQINAAREPSLYTLPPCLCPVSCPSICPGYYIAASCPLCRKTISLMAEITDSVVAFLFRHLEQTPQSDTPLLELASFKQRDPKSLASIPAFTLLLNLVKSHAEMVYELVMSLQTNIIDGSLPDSSSLEEWESLLGVVSVSLEFLKQAVAPKQQHMILDMQASFFGSTGVCVCVCVCILHLLAPYTLTHTLTLTPISC